MHLVQILLPIADNDGKPFPHAQFAALRQELSDRFGGVTIFSRNPAEGFWGSGDRPARDDIVIFEVMCDPLDRAWWRARREALEQEFRQEEIVVRAEPIERL
jgi:hypothetical protein